MNHSHEIHDLNRFYNYYSSLDYNHICYFGMALANEFGCYLYNNYLKLYIGEKLRPNY